MKITRKRKERREKEKQTIILNSKKGYIKNYGPWVQTSKDSSKFEILLKIFSLKLKKKSDNSTEKIQILFL